MEYVFYIAIYLFLIKFILFSKCDLIVNPIKITDEPDFDDYIINLESTTVSTPNGTRLNIIKDKNEILYNGKTYFLNKNFFLCQDESDYYFFFAEYNYYKKQPNNNNQITSLTLSKNFPFDIQYLGYIRENENSYYGNSADRMCGIEEDEIIIYGKKGDYVYFNFTKGDSYLIDFGNIGDKISCKLIRSARYICAYFSDDQIKLNILLHKFIQYNVKGFEIYETIVPQGFSGYDNLILYETNLDFYNILCASKKGAKDEAKCIAVFSEVWYWSPGFTKRTFTFNLTHYDFSLSQTHECYLTGFNSEFLSCCAGNNIINCNRNNKSNFHLINTFSINLLGEISNIIITNKSDHAIISYKNETSDKNYLYNYYIYPPKCKTIYFEINSFQSFEFNISKLFELKTNTIYTFIFHNLPLDYGIIKINGEKINTGDYKIEWQAGKDKFYFESNNYNITSKYDIIYNISIKETYSSICNISIIIKECYHSCKGCIEDIDSETNENMHNCIECKEEEKYFHYAQEENNCYNEEEMKAKFTGWYFDDQRNLFAKCNSNCKTCFGPSENNCLSCKYSIFYAYEGICRTICPDKTFPTRDDEGNKICKDCFPNCATCNELGIYNDMKCLTCSDDQIKYENNCFDIYDNKAKSFYNPLEYSEITSCLGLFDKYIIENTNECINKPEIGYFVSNNKTGVLSPCHPDCKTCSKNFTDRNPNCDSCSNETLKVLEGKCVQNCPEGYYQNDIYCLKCHKNCKTCNSGIIKDNIGKIKSMGCTKCIDSLAIDIYNAQEYEEQFQEFTNLRFLEDHISPHHQLIEKYQQ